MIRGKQFCFRLAVISFTCALAGAGQEKNSSTAGTPVKAPGQLDQLFLKTAAVGNTAEVQLGRMVRLRVGRRLDVRVDLVSLRQM